MHPEQTPQQGPQQQPAAPPPWPGHPQPVGMPAGRRTPTALIVGILAAVVLVPVGATVGVHAYAKHTVCGALEGDSPLAGGSAPEGGTPGNGPDVAEIRDAADGLRTYAWMLVFDGDLKDAVNGLADDVDQMADLVGAPGDDGAGAFAELFTIAASVNTHARQAQRACDLPVTGIFGT